MRSAPSLDPRNLFLAALFVLGLSLVILAGATGWRWLSANWSPACPRLLRVPAPPSFAAPWRLTAAHPAPPCPSRP
ncbi:MAG: hypothetical protein ACXU82_04295 [Caulobacteraceae bacterium]